jgi:hypothetical protein
MFKTKAKATEYARQLLKVNGGSYDVLLLAKAEPGSSRDIHGIRGRYAVAPTSERDAYLADGHERLATVAQ